MVFPRLMLADGRPGISAHSGARCCSEEGVTFDVTFFLALAASTVPLCKTSRDNVGVKISSLHPWHANSPNAIWKAGFRTHRSKDASGEGSFMICAATANWSRALCGSPPGNLERFPVENHTSSSAANRTTSGITCQHARGLVLQ